MTKFYYNYRCMTALPVAMIASLAWGAAAAAQSQSPLASIYNCKTETDPTARLACYDAAVGIIEVKEAKQEIVTIDAKAAQKIQKEAFGFSLPSLPKLGLPKFGSADGKQKNTVELEVSAVKETRNGLIITMKNGQVWHEVSGQLNYVPKGDLTARIKKATMGTYRLSLSNGKSRVRGLGVRRAE